MPVALLALALGGFAIGTTEFVIMGLLPEVAADVGISIPTAGHLISGYAAGVVVGALVLTAATVRLPRKTVLFGLMGLFAAGNLLSALAPTYELLLTARVIAGLPHGAFFGVGAVVAAGMVEPGRRARAVSMMFLGLTIANVVGVPGATLLGQSLGWRYAFAAVAVIGVATMVAVSVLVPTVERAPDDEVPVLRHELAALRRPQVLLSLAVVTFGFGGLFACYSYVTPMMTDVAGFAPNSITGILIVVGVGMTIGSYLGGKLADWAPERTLVAGLVGLMVVLVLLSLGASVPWLAVTLLFFVGLFSMGMGPAIQTRIIGQAEDAPTMVSSAIQSGFNVANSLGAWLGGLVIAAGAGFRAPNLVGAGLVAVGLALLILSLVLNRRERSAAVLAAEAEEPVSVGS
ncbi:MFS transporter [Rhodococcus sp. X156]|uniref:MFS transporter n=1 Tax=Rhodococcus sp. X156 TaxID=2499145 RepID=UPI000FDB3C8E|nr:MFS transporter [Rhodococcus sp. X156]